MSQSGAPYPCPECGGETKKQVTAPNVIVGGTPDFSKREKRDLDVVVGKQAEQRWEQIHKETEVRNDVRRKTGKSALGRKADGTYVPVSQERLAARESGYKRFEHAKKTGIKVERND
jgi:hypothetical protein